MPARILLSEREPLIFKATRWLISLSAQRPVDLSHCAVLVPTTGSGRRLRAELVRLAVERGKGLLSPAVLTPMGFLSRGVGEKVAGRVDTLLAWAQVISEVSVEKFPLLLSGFSDHRALAFRIGESLRELCALLAEAGLTPVSAQAQGIAAGQEDRWKELKFLYELYLNRLADAGLEDSEAARIRVAGMGAPPENIQHVIVAGVPDLNRIVETYLRTLESAGISVTVLIDAPHCKDEDFDAWGRPDRQAWSQKFLRLRLEDFVVAADPASEAQIVAGLTGSAAVGVCVADSELVPFHLRAMHKRGLGPYDPAGKSLALFECATLSRLWLAFASKGRVSELRTLAEHPVFLNLLCREAHQPPTTVLSALDELQTKILVETVDDAAAFLGDSSTSASSTRDLIVAIEKLRRTFGGSGSVADLPEFLRVVYAGREVAPGSAEAEAVAALANLLDTVLESPLCQSNFAEQIFCEEMKNLTVFGPHGEADTDLNGWLEAQWLPYSSLIVSGCTEGALPARIAGHPFVPDSLRVDWRLHNNLERFARDTYVLHCLFAARKPGAVKLTLSRVRADGEPAKPSRLLFRCSDAELSARVRKVFEPVAPLHTSQARERAWHLEIPPRPPPSSLRVTAFRDYLQCPLRFYLKHVLDMRRFESPKVEMDALDFGNVLHETLEAFAQEEAIRDSSDYREIESFVLNELDVIFMNRFGRRLSLPLRVQREGSRARLRQFAKVQAAQRRIGWRLRHGELRFEVEKTLHLAGLPIIGRIDRVDVHEGTGQRRILDYKTSAKRRSARSQHFDSAPGKREPVQWRDLQLPLYRALAEFCWPGEPLPPVVGYFLLPERVEESGIDELALDEALFVSAVTAAERVAERISRGVFWPPGEAEFDDFVSLFLGEDPDKIINESSKEFLSGRVLIDSSLVS
jgi:ATP-dependent helicase/nuclease subunit B